jgi:ketosteroid isomerase-like protein
MTDPELDPQRRETISRFFAAIQAGDYAALQEALTPDAITRWPQSGERMTGAMSCVRVYENYPRGTTAIRRPSDLWAAETCGSRSWWPTTAMGAGTRSASSSSTDR